MKKIVYKKAINSDMEIVPIRFIVIPNPISNNIT